MANLQVLARKLLPFATVLCLAIFYFEGGWRLAKLLTKSNNNNNNIHHIPHKSYVINSNKSSIGFVTTVIKAIIVCTTVCI